MKYGIFGGTFDPVHLGHLLLAESCREQVGLDHVFFVPTGVPPHKRAQSNRTPGHQRAEMLEAALAGFAEFSVSRFEIDRSGVSFTAHTLQHFHAMYPQAGLYLILGADMYNDLPNWYKPDLVRQLATPIVACRPGSPPPKADWTVPMPQTDISSSDIRRRIAESKSIRFHVPTPVEEYIRQHELYR